jgi:hypothetical protein
MGHHDVEKEIKLAETVKTVLDEGKRVTETILKNSSGSIAGTTDAMKAAALQDLKDVFEGGSGFFGNALQALKGNTLANTNTAAPGMSGGSMFSSASSNQTSASSDQTTSSSMTTKSANVSTSTAKDAGTR